MFIDVSFDNDFDKIFVDLKRNIRGYNAAYTMIAFKYVEEEKQKEMKEEMVRYIAQDADIESLTYENTDLNSQDPDKPMVIKSKFSSESFIEKAGNDIIFNIGNLIGPQTELYQEEERKLDVVNDFNRGYLRKIKVRIPDGFKISNPDDLNMNFQVEEDGKVIYQFVSNYKIESDYLTVDVNEFYDKIYYPKEKFEEYRQVINAAADFNKINLILQEN